MGPHFVSRDTKAQKPLSTFTKAHPRITGVKNFLAGSLVHLIDGGTEPPRMRGPSKVPTQSQRRATPRPKFIISLSFRSFQTMAPWG